MKTRSNWIKLFGFLAVAIGFVADRLEDAVKDEEIKELVEAEVKKAMTADKKEGES